MCKIYTIKILKEVNILDVFDVKQFQTLLQFIVKVLVKAVGSDIRFDGDERY